MNKLNIWKPWTLAKQKGLGTHCGFQYNAEGKLENHSLLHPKKTNTAPENTPLEKEKYPQITNFWV